MRTANLQAFSRTLADALVQFRDAVDRRDKHGADAYYCLAMGLITGATLSGGLSKEKGVVMLESLAENRARYAAAFGGPPGLPGIQVE